MAIDILVILVYFVFLIVIGWAFRSFSQNTSDYFKGGGKMLWWMVGATAFMVQFSALVFTGIAGKALTDGLSVMMVFSEMLLVISAIICSLRQNHVRCALLRQWRACAYATVK